MEAEPSPGARASVASYIKTLPPTRPFGLVFGVPRPASSRRCPGETVLVPRLIAAITRGVPAGTELRAPADVVLDPKHGLVLHPAVAVVLARRAHTLRPDGSIWGAPDVIVELSWPAISRRLRCVKLRWYHQYGVRECWLVNLGRNRIEVIPLARMEATGGEVMASVIPYLFSGKNPIASQMLPDVQLTASSLFHGIDMGGWSRTRQRFEATFDDEQSEGQSFRSSNGRNARHARRKVE